jgi:hypothetical protein
MRNLFTSNTDQATVTVAPDMAATTAIDTGTGAGGTDTASAENLTSEAPAGTTGQGDGNGLLAAVEAANNAKPGTPEGDAAMTALTSAVEAATNAPVEADKVAGATKPAKNKGESNKAYNKRLAAWQAKQAEKPVEPAAPVEAEKPAPEGATPKAEKPAATVTVTAAKPAKLTPREAALANVDFVGGYDLSKWPRALAHIKPSLEAIQAVRATGVLSTFITKNELAFAVYVHPAALGVNVYDVATALQAVLGGAHDHKMNVVNQKAKPAGMVTLRQGRVPSVVEPQGKAAVSYFAPFTGRAMKLITASFAKQGLTVPLWLSEPDRCMAEQAAATLAQSNVPA